MFYYKLKLYKTDLKIDFIFYILQFIKIEKLYII